MGLEAFYFAQAYWIDSQGNIVIPLMRHIGTILSCPEYFGETDLTIKESFYRLDEPISSSHEGLARNEIIFRVLRRGFMRIRENRHNWSIETWEFNPRLRDTMIEWARVLVTKPCHKFDELTICQIASRIVERATICQVADWQQTSPGNLVTFIPEEALPTCHGRQVWRQRAPDNQNATSLCKDQLVKDQPIGCKKNLILLQSK